MYRVSALALNKKMKRSGYVSLGKKGVVKDHMGIIDRMILSIYTLLLMAISIIVIILSLGLFSFDIIWTIINDNIYGRYEVALAAVVFLLVSLRFFLAGVRTRSKHDPFIHRGENGSVFITIEAVRNMVEKVARHSKGVRWVKVRVNNLHEGLLIKIRAIISPECNVLAVSAELQQKVRERVKNTVGIELTEVEVVVEDISNDFKTKQRVE